MTYHKTLTADRWLLFSLGRRVLMVGSELKRYLLWRERGDEAQARKAAERAVELLDLCVETAQPGAQRREFCRMREIAKEWTLTERPIREAQLVTRSLIGTL